MACLFLAGVVASMHFAKVAPIMSEVAGALGLGLVQSAWAVSVLGLVGVLFAIAAGAVVAALGLRRSLLLGLVGGAVLALAVSVAPNAALFLLGRFLEGFSHLLIVIAAPALMAVHASERARPLAMALWGCFFGVGFALSSALAPWALSMLGWRGWLAGHAVLLALVGVLVWQALRAANVADAASTTPAAVVSARSMWATHLAVYRSGPPLLLALCFCAYAAMFLATLTFLSPYLQQQMGWSASASGQFVALLSVLTLSFTLLAGAWVRAGVSLRTGLCVAFALTGVGAVGLFALALPNPARVALMLLTMAGFGLVPGLVFANVPRVAPTPARAALAYGAIAQFGNVGTFSGTPLFALAYQHMAWAGAALYLVAIAALGAVLAYALQRAMRRPTGSDAALA